MTAPLPEAHPLTLVAGFRDRDLERVRRFLASLEGQTFQDFTLIFVDYGSARPLAEDVRALVEGCSFARCLYSDTRGMPWNRARALNIGARQAAAGYIMTTDVDMIFPPGFLAALMRRVDPGRAVFCYPYFLPRDFDDWSHVERYAGQVPAGTKAARGGCQCIAADVFARLRGFDETYRYWGLEDHDFSRRLELLGITETWLNEDTSLFHQWHPEVTHTSRGVMPEGAWRGLLAHYAHHYQETARNPGEWGRALATEERAVFRFVDPDARTLRSAEQLVWAEAAPDSDAGLLGLLRQLIALPAGHALAVPHAAFPRRCRVLNRLIGLVNGLLDRAQPGSTHLDYSPNRLHAFLADLTEPSSDLVADYYLNLPVRDGVSVLVRA